MRKRLREKKERESQGGGERTGETTWQEVLSDADLQ